MATVHDDSTVNTWEFIPDEQSIGFAPELVRFIKSKHVLTTYRFGRKYGHFQVGDIVNYQNSATGKTIGQLKIVSKRETTFSQLPLNDPTYGAYTDKEHQRKVLSGYYAFIGREILDSDLFLVFDFELVSKQRPSRAKPKK